MTKLAFENVDGPIINLTDELVQQGIRASSFVTGAVIPVDGSFSSMTI